MDRFEIKNKMAVLLKKARKAENLTQEQLARKSGITRSMIARIEGREKQAVPGLNLFTKLMGCMGYKTGIVSKKGRKEFKVIL